MLILSTGKLLITIGKQKENKKKKIPTFDFLVNNIQNCIIQLFQKQKGRTVLRFTFFNIFLVKGGSEIMTWGGGEMLWDVSTGREKRGSADYLLNFISLRNLTKSQHWKEDRDRDGQGTGACKSGVRAKGLQPPHPKNLFFHSFLSECRVLLYIHMNI